MDRIDLEYTDLVIVAPSHIELPGDTFIVLDDECDLKIDEVDIDGAVQLIEQLDRMAASRSRRNRYRNDVIRYLDRSIRSGFITVIRSDYLFDLGRDSVRHGDRLSDDSLLIFDADSFYSANERVSSNPTPHP